MKQSSSSSSASFRTGLIIQGVIGVVLAVLTMGVMGLVRDAAHNQMLGWLNLSGAGAEVGVGLMGLLLFILGVDILWVLFFILWLLKKKLRLKGPDNTLRLQ